MSGNRALSARALTALAQTSVNIFSFGGAVADFVASATKASPWTKSEEQGFRGVKSVRRPGEPRWPPGHCGGDPAAVHEADEAEWKSQGPPRTTRKLNVRSPLVQAEPSAGAAVVAVHDSDPRSTDRPLPTIVIETRTQFGANAPTGAVCLSSHRLPRPVAIGIVRADSVAPRVRCLRFGARRMFVFGFGEQPIWLAG